MRFLITAVVVMGVLIVTGVVVLGTVIVRRGSAPAPIADVVLAEPAGTHIVGVSAISDRMALRLEGGGPDRVVLLDSRTGQKLGQVALAH